MTNSIGRVGADILIPEPSDFDISADPSEDLRTLTGHLRGADLEETLALGGELVAQLKIGEPIPVVAENWPGFTGFYLQADADVGARQRTGGLSGKGYLPFTFTGVRQGGYSQVELKSDLTMVSIADDFATIPSYSWAPAVGARNIDAGAATPVLIERVGAAGTQLVVTEMDPGTHPTWSVPPAGYYLGGVELYAASRLRAGLELPMNPTDWLLGNAHMQIRPSAYQATSDGGLEVRFHNGTEWSDTWIKFHVDWGGTDTVGEWHFVSFMGNTAGQGRVRLERDASEEPTETTAKHQLDVTLCRGKPFGSFWYKFTGAAEEHAVRQTDGLAATRPGGDASYVTGDSPVHGDKWILGTPLNFNVETGTQLQVDVATRLMPFWIGAAINNAANGTGNGPADLAQQYVGQVAERVRASLR